MKLIAGKLARSDSVVDDGVIIGIIYYGNADEAKRFRDWFEQARQAVEMVNAAHARAEAMVKK